MKILLETRRWVLLSFYLMMAFLERPFKRPAFQEAIDLVEQGRVKNFIVKDLSRFGRDYLKVGAFTEVAFPEKGVRFIAINDNVDSDREDDNSLAPFIRTCLMNGMPEIVLRRSRR